MHWWFLSIPLLSAFAYRVRGSSWTSNDAGIKGLRVAKLAVGAAPVSLALFLLGAPWYLALAVFAAVALADTLPHGDDQGAVTWGQDVMLWLNSVASAIAPVAVLIYIGHVEQAWIAAGFTFLIVPAYIFGNRLPLHFSIGPVGFDEGPEWGEVLYGLSRTLFVLV